MCQESIILGIILFDPCAVRWTRVIVHSSPSDLRICGIGEASNMPQKTKTTRASARIHTKSLTSWLTDRGVCRGGFQSCSSTASSRASSKKISNSMPEAQRLLTLAKAVGNVVGPHFGPLPHPIHVYSMH